MLLSISSTALVITPAENSQVRSQSIKAILFIALFAYTSPELIMQEKMPCGNIYAEKPCDLIFRIIFKGKFSITLNHITKTKT